MAKNKLEIIFRRWASIILGGNDKKFEKNATQTFAEFDEYCGDEYPDQNPTISSVYRWMKLMDSEVSKRGSFELFDLQEGRLPEPSTEEVDLKIQRIGDTKFPNFRIWRSGTSFDKLWSDFETDGGLYSGVVCVTTGESGVGKSTLLIDYLTKLQEFNRKSLGLSECPTKEEIAAKGIDPKDVLDCLYITTEMTRNDVYFYAKRMPKINKIETLYASDYMGGKLANAVRKAFTELHHQVVLLDSYQDLIEKLRDDCQMTLNAAENFLVHLMVEAAETRGVSIIAIQHLTKGGQYVGRTYLKHATTAMLELRFDQLHERFAVFSKNRRGGSMTHIPIYFRLSGEDVTYDETRLCTMITSEFHSKTEEERKIEIQNKFGAVFSILDEIKNKEGEQVTEVEKEEPEE